MNITPYMKWQAVSIIMFFVVLYFVSYYAQKADITQWHYGPNTVVLMGLLSASLLVMIFTKWLYEKWKNFNE